MGQYSFKDFTKKSYLLVVVVVIVVENNNNINDNYTGKAES